MNNTDIARYHNAAKSASKTRTTSLLGYGAAAAGLFVAGQADADIVYSGVLNAGFNLSTVNASATNAINGLVFNSASGADAFGFMGNNRGPANGVGSTDIVWAVGAAYFGNNGGGVIANGAAFPASINNLASGANVSTGGTAASLAWVAAGLPGLMAIDPLGVGDNGSVTALMGFSFAGVGGTNFGWARIKLTSAGGLPTEALIVDWAYENSGGAIAAGAIPTPGPLALLGLAAGASGFRKRRAQVA